MGRMFLRATHVTCSRSRCARTVMGLVAMAGLLGCSSTGPSRNTEGLEDLQPVSGSVSFEGKPTPGAIVMFFRADDLNAKGVRVAGVVDDDGFFEMTTGVADGMLPGVKEGTYFATITWTKRVDPDDKDSDTIDLLPEKYNAPTTANLKVEIKAGENALEPFVLTP